MYIYGKQILNKLEECKEYENGADFGWKCILFVSCFIHKVTLGTNPICLAAPAKDGDDFVLDMATTSVALGKVNCSNYVFFLDIRY